MSAVDWSDAEIKELGLAVGHEIAILLLKSVKYMTVKYSSNVRRTRGKRLCM